MSTWVVLTDHEDGSDIVLRVSEIVGVSQVEEPAVRVVKDGKDVTPSPGAYVWMRMVEGDPPEQTYWEVEETVEEVRLKLMEEEP